MTDWPDDWFRNGAGGAGAQAGAEPPTVDRAGAQAAGATAPGGRLPAADEVTQPGTVRSSSAASAGAGGAGSAWPEQPALYAPNRAGRARRVGLTGWRRWLRPKVVLIAIGALICALLLATIGGYFYLDSKLTKINALTPSAATAGQNWLITGSTGHLTRSLIVRLHTGYDYDHLSDTILVLHVPANGDRPTLVSLPRDSYVPIPGHGMNKINAAYVFGGATLLVRTVQNITGLHIDHYLGIGYDGLVNVVNAVGGVQLCLPGPVIDAKAGIRLPKGCDTLNGRQALGFVRTRQFAVGDLQRVQDQRVLLRALLKKMTTFGTLANPFAILPAAVGSADAVTVDKGTGLLQLVKVAFALKNPVSTTVPFGGFATNSAGAVVLWNNSEARQLFHDLATDQPVPRGLITGSKLAPTA